MTVPLPSGLDQYRLLGRSGLRVSPLCLGAMTFGKDWGWGSDRETSYAIYREYLDRGGNFIDTANFYTNGTSESLLGEFMGTDRDAVVLATKFTLNTRPGDPNAGGNHRKSIAQSVEASLRRLRTDYIDLYWLHAWDFTTPVEEILRALDDLVRAGKVLYLAISDVPAWKISQLNTVADLRGWTRFTALQVDYSLVQRESERDLIPMAEELGLAVLPWSPLGGGLLTGKYTRQHLEDQLAGKGPKGGFGEDNRGIGLDERKLTIAETVVSIAKEIGQSPAQVALNWCLQKPGVVSPIFGARTMEQLLDNLGAVEFTLAPEHMAALDELSAISLGFPHEFLRSPGVRGFVTGNTSIETRGM